jgi:hypothetical protein
MSDGSKSFLVIAADGKTEITVAGENVAYSEHGISVTYENFLGFIAQSSAKVVRHGS